MKRYDVLKRLDIITEMKDEEIAINAEWIREVALASLNLIKQKYKKPRAEPHRKEVKE
jgi:hypothetical protein